MLNDYIYITVQCRGSTDRAICIETSSFREQWIPKSVIKDADKLPENRYWKQEICIKKQYAMKYLKFSIDNS